MCVEWLQPPTATPVRVWSTLLCVSAFQTQLTWTHLLFSGFYQFRRSKWSVTPTPDWEGGAWNIFSYSCSRFTDEELRHFHQNAKRSRMDHSCSVHSHRPADGSSSVPRGWSLLCPPAGGQQSEGGTGDRDGGASHLDVWSPLWCILPPGRPAAAAGSGRSPAWQRKQAVTTSHLLFRNTQRTRVTAASLTAETGPRLKRSVRHRRHQSLRPGLCAAVKAGTAAENMDTPVSSVTYGNRQCGPEPTRTHQTPSPAFLTRF